MPEDYEKTMRTSEFPRSHREVATAWAQRTSEIPVAPVSLVIRVIVAALVSAVARVPLIPSQVWKTHVTTTSGVIQSRCFFVAREAI